MDQLAITATASAGPSGQLYCVKDELSGTYYLADTGAAYSVLPRRSGSRLARTARASAAGAPTRRRCASVEWTLPGASYKRLCLSPILVQILLNIIG
jgi:hypothetical protein